MPVLKIIKALSDENRLRVLNVLAKKELCVCELEQVLGITQSNTSRHLIKLSEAEIIESEKKGQFVFYHLNQKTLEKHPFLKDLVVQELPIIEKFRVDTDKLDLLEKQGSLCKRDSCCSK